MDFSPPEYDPQVLNICMDGRRITLKVTVALVGTPEHISNFDILDLDAGEGAAFADLPSTSFDVSPNETLKSLLGRAAVRFDGVAESGGPFAPTWVSFYRPEHAVGYLRRDETTVLTLVEEDGRARWNVPYFDPSVTFAALIRASEAKALVGDPLRPYLVIRPAYGNGILPDWSEFLAGLFVLRETLSLVADGSDAVAVAQWTRARARRMLARFRRVPEVVQRHREAWEHQRGWPNDVHALVGRPVWHPDDLAILLGVSTDEAKTLLDGRGYSPDKDTGLWRVAHDLDSEALSEIYEFVVTRQWSHIVGDSVETVRHELRRSITRASESSETAKDG